MSVFFYPILTAALFYLGSRAKITWWLHSRYSPGFLAFMDCSACTGFWYGAILAQTLGRASPVTIGAVPIATPVGTLTVALCSLVLTPMVAALHHLALEALGSVVPPDDRRDDANGTVWISSEAIDATPPTFDANGEGRPEQLDLSLRDALNIPGRF